jgi:uncharacterized membrane protein YdjX (TVP38/TMEM64 family)
MMEDSACKLPRPNSMASRFSQAVRRHAGILRWIILGAIVVIVVLLLRSLPVERPIVWLKERADELGHWAPLVFVLLFVGLTVFILPGWPLNVAAGVVFGPLLGGALASLASNASAAVSFFIGRCLARTKADRMVRRYPKLEAVYQTMDTDVGWKVVAAVRLSHALPFGLQNLLLGASPVRFWPYLLTTVLVTLPGIFVIAYLGYIGAATLEAEAEATSNPWRWVMRAGGLAVAVLAILYLARVFRRAIKEHTGLEPNKHQPAELTAR